MLRGTPYGVTTNELRLTLPLEKRVTSRSDARQPWYPVSPKGRACKDRMSRKGRDARPLRSCRLAAQRLPPASAQQAGEAQADGTKDQRTGDRNRLKFELE